MESTLHDLKTRRSCRSYTDEIPSKEILDKIAEAGTYAPTGRGLQAPKIVVVRDRETIEYIEKLNASAWAGKMEHPFYGAPVLMIVLADPEIRTYVDDGNMVIGNILNAAHALGVASCYIYRARETFDMPEGKELLRKWGIDERYRGIGNCILGYAAVPYADPKPRKDDYILYV